jgi:hypothetical protein
MAEGTMEGGLLLDHDEVVLLADALDTFDDYAQVTPIVSDLEAFDRLRTLIAVAAAR